jgi:hypothetical protein
MFRRSLAAIVRPVPRNRRAKLWADVYCQTFETGTETTDEDASTAEQ